MFSRTLGRSGTQVSAMELGCWAIGGAFGDNSDGPETVTAYGAVDGTGFIRAVHRALDIGVTSLDTSDAYECGHSETIPGPSLRGRRDQVAIATKSGYVPDEARRCNIGEDASPDYVRPAYKASLRRPSTNYIDLYQFHNDHDLDEAELIRGTLERLVDEGKVRFYGWSVIDAERVRVFFEGPHFTAAQHVLSTLREGPDMVESCEELNPVSIKRGSLLMGVLTGKFNVDTTFPQDDVRRYLKWDFSQGRFGQYLRAINRVREVLTSGSRTPAQGALAWIRARSDARCRFPVSRPWQKSRRTSERWGSVC